MDSKSREIASNSLENLYVLGLGMGFLGVDNASDGSKKKESSIIITKSSKTGAQSDFRPGAIVGETNWCLKRSRETIPESVPVHDKNEQTKSKMCEEARLERNGSSERIYKTGTYYLDRMDKEKSNEISSKTASSSSNNNNGCSPYGMGGHNTFNFIYTDPGQLAQAMRGMVFNNISSIQQQTGVSGYPQSSGGIFSNYFQIRWKSIQILTYNTKACYIINRKAASINLYHSLRRLLNLMDLL
jgi:hypothetical protein